MGVRVRQKIKGKGNPWWVFVSHNGKRTSRKVGSKRAADIVAAKIQAKISLGEFGFMDRKAMPTFREYSEKWLKGYVKLNCRESTVDEYMGALNFHVLTAMWIYWTRCAQMHPIRTLRVKTGKKSMSNLHGKTKIGFEQLAVIFDNIRLRPRQ